MDGFKGDDDDDYQKAIEKGFSAHNLGQDNPWEVGFQLAMAIDNAFILGYPFLIMAFLGWVPGTLCLLGGGLISLYANVLLARLTVIDGVRYYRFRDISYKVYGSFGFWITAVLQWGNILAGNVGLVILAGQAAHGVYAQYHEFKTGLLLPEWIVITGVFCIVLAILIPDLHYLRIFSIIAAVCSVAFVAIIIGIAIHDGNNNPPRKYDTGYGATPASKIFDAMGALGSIAFAYSTCILPEIQATVREPAVANMYKAMIVNYGIGAPIFIAMTFVAFWAYGSGDPGVSFLVINSLSGPKWAITVAWVCVFIQCVVSLQIYSAPVYETIDTAFNRPGGSWTLYNMFVRVLFRVPYIVGTAFVAALLPFFGDFVALMGALTVLPANFVLTFMLYIEVNRERLSTVSIIFHWLLVAIFAAITMVAAVASLRYIIVDATNYSVFANL